MLPRSLNPLDAGLVGTKILAVVAYDALRHFDSSALSANRVGRLTSAQESIMRRRIGVRGLWLGLAFIAVSLLLLALGFNQATTEYPALRLSGLVCAVPGIGLGVMFLVGAALGSHSMKSARCQAISGPLRLHRVELRDTEGNLSHQHRLSIGDVQFRITRAQYEAMRHRNGSHATGYRAGRGGTLINIERD